MLTLALTILVGVHLMAAAIIVVLAYFLIESRRRKIAALVLLLSVILLNGYQQYVYNFGHDVWRVCTVTSKDRGGGSSSYRVYTEECGTLSNYNSFFRLKGNSAELWNQIPDQGAVRLRTVGVQTVMETKFPNIVDVEPIDPTSSQ